MITIVLSLFYLGSMVGLVSAGRKADDRLGLLSAILAVLFTVVLARALLPVHPIATWAWVTGVALFGAATGLAVMRWRKVPWIAPGTSRWSIAGSAFWVTVLVVLTGAALWSIL